MSMLLLLILVDAPSFFRYRDSRDMNIRQTFATNSSLDQQHIISEKMTFFTRSKVIIMCCALGGNGVNLIPFSYGLFLPYIFSYLYSFDDEIHMAMMHVHAPLCLVVATGTAWTFGIFQRYVKQRILHLVNGLGLSFWAVLLYFFGQSYIAITAAVALMGFHAGQLHVFFSQRVTEEGQRYSSTANGIYGFCFGLAGIWGNILSGAFINPKSVEPEPLYSVNDTTQEDDSYAFMDSDVLDRVPENWLIIAILTFLLLLPGYFVIAGPPTTSEEEKQKLLENESSAEESTAEVKVCSPTGLTLFLTTIVIGTSSMSAFDLYKDYGLKVIHDDSFLNIGGILIPVVGAVGRILWGTLGDHVSLRILFLTGNGLSFILQVLMYPTRQSKIGYVLNTSLLSIMPGMMTLLPPSVKKYMGSGDIALKYGIILTGEVFGCIYYILMTSIIRKYLNDLVLVVVLGIPAALAIIPTALFIRDPPTTAVHR